ncbi:MAG: Ppx/GppA family phosphatase, partial [Verrucomicrobia bacterium]|nr:Ppx/GppA family phosphatase [Verrucomicrobiota bacterium]
MTRSQPQSERGELRAIIDIGTNSVKLLIAEVSGRVVTPVHEVSEQTRLGRGFYETHELQSEAIGDTLRVLDEFKYVAAHRGARRLQVVATSAVRDARNQRTFLDAVLRHVGVKVDVLTGDLEADWVYQGVTSDPALAGQRLLIVDVGGGSTEFILGQGE